MKTKRKITSDDKSATKYESKRDIIILSTQSNQFKAITNNKSKPDKPANYNRKMKKT